MIDSDSLVDNTGYGSGNFLIDIDILWNGENGRNNKVFLEITDLPLAILTLNFISLHTIHTHGSPWTFPTHILILSPRTCYCQAALSLNCDRSLTSIKAAASSLKFRVLATEQSKAPSVFHISSRFFVYECLPCQYSIYLKIFIIYPFITCQAGTQVFWWTSNGEYQYAVVKSSSRLSDVRSYNLLIPERINEFLLFRERKCLCSNWMGNPRQLLYRAHLLIIVFSALTLF